MASKGNLEEKEEVSIMVAIQCYVSFIILTVFGHLRDFLRNTGFETNKSAVESNRKHYVPLYQSFESFFARNIYRRVCDAWNTPIASVPGANIDIVQRQSDDHNWTFKYTGETLKVINMGSYNYLGFAENEGINVDKVENTIREYRTAVGTSSHEIGTTAIVNELETLLANFLRVESSIVFGMGFATNSTNIAILAQKGSLILSDELNHASVILGCKLSGASIKVFKHNDMKDLETKIRESIVYGQYRTRRPWKKIIIVVEGIYSMEGTIINLPEIIRLKKKYKCYVYLDEAHSIGAIGSTGRGVTEYFGCDTTDIDLLMGTFTKSFGAAGGYLAGKKNVIDYIRAHSHSAVYATSMSTTIAQQIISVIKIITESEEGVKRISRLARNVKYFRSKLKNLGFIVYGNDNSPVVPLMVCFCSTLACVIRLALNEGIGTVGAAFPATSLTTARVRFCVSAAHTKHMLDRVLRAFDEIGNRVHIKYSNKPKDGVNIAY